LSALRTIHVVAAAIVLDGQCLIGRRLPGGSAGELWEFPGGKVEAGETPERALVREIQEELGIDIEVGALLGRSETHTEERHLILDLYLARWRAGELEARAHSELRWTDAELPDPALFAAADRPLLAPVAAHLERATRRDVLPLPKVDEGHAD